MTVVRLDNPSNRIGRNCGIHVVAKVLAKIHLPLCRKGESVGGNVIRKNVTKAIKPHAAPLHAFQRSWLCSKFAMQDSKFLATPSQHASIR